MTIAFYCGTPQHNLPVVYMGIKAGDFHRNSNSIFKTRALSMIRPRYLTNSTQLLHLLTKYVIHPVKQEFSDKRYVYARHH
jgi:hypothetical protein